LLEEIESRTHLMMDQSPHFHIFDEIHACFRLWSQENEISNDKNNMKFTLTLNQEISQTGPHPLSATTMKARYG